MATLKFGTHTLAIKEDTIGVMDTAESLVKEGGIVKPFFIKEVPESYAHTGVDYSEVPITEFTQKRNINNAALSSLSAYLPFGAVIAGGFMTSVFNSEHKASDIDMFFTGPDAFLNTYDLLCNPPDDTEAWAWHGYSTKTTRAELLIHGEEYRTVNFTNSDPGKQPIQLIKMIWFNDPAHVIDSFDFTICQFSATKDRVVFNPMALIDLHNKEIIVHRWQSPIEILYRVLKYAKKGYKLSHKTLVNACEGIRKGGNINPKFPISANYIGH